jgi:hypothetical protein
MKKRLGLLISILLIFGLTFLFNNNEVVCTDTEKNPVINMSEQEIMQLGEQKKLEFKKLYYDFLTYSKSSLIFECSQHYYVYDGLTYFEILSAEFQSINDLYSYFINFCTPEYSMELIVDSRNNYRDIDGKLYLTDTMLTDGVIGFVGSGINSYKIDEDKIIFKCTGFSDDAFFPDYNADNPVHHYENDIEIIFVLKYVYGNWLIDSCSNIDVFTLL